MAGLAYHCYLSDPSSMAAEQARSQTQLELETACSSRLSNIAPAQMAIRSLRNWAHGVQLWNAALDQNLGPKIGHGCQGITPPYAGQQCLAPVIVDTRRHSYRLTSDFWALAHFSKFIHLGAQRIDSTTPAACSDSPAGGYACGAEDVAFRNPDGSQVVVASTHDGTAHTLDVVEQNRSFSYQLADGATISFVWPAPRPRISALLIRGCSIACLLSEPARLTLRLLLRRSAGRGHAVFVARRQWQAGRNRIRAPARDLMAPGIYRLELTARAAGGGTSRIWRRYVVPR